MAQKEPLNMMPSTHTKATSRSAKEREGLSQVSAQSALVLTAGMHSMARNRVSRSSADSTRLSIRMLYCSLCTASIMVWKA